MRLGHLIAELRRRNVFRVAIAYLAAAWLVIQLVNEIGPIVNAPEWLAKLVLALLAGGLFIAVVLSWIYELTAEGIRTTEEVDLDESLRPLEGRKIDFLIIGFLVLALGYFIWESRIQSATPVSSRIESVAVLPFRDMSPNQDQLYFADGMAEELVNALSRIEELKVAGRTSSFTFRNSDLSPATIASQLGVSHLLEGGVRTSQGQLRVTAQLIHARDGLQVWSHEFEGDLADVFQIQDEISRRVIDSLKASIDTPGNEPAARADIVAYDEYLLGRYQLARRTSESLHQARLHFEAAIEIDPTYSRSWSALATTMVFLPWYGSVADSAATAQLAREAAQRALALDEANSEAWAALGTVAMTYDWQWDEAEVGLRRAVELNPRDVGNVNLYGDYLYITGDYEAAQEWEGLAAELEPVSAVHQHELALVYGLMGRVEDAIDAELKAVSLDPEFRNGWSSLARFYIESGDLQAAEKLLKSPGVALRESSRLILALKLDVLHGEPETARTKAYEMLAMVRDGRASPVAAAQAFAILGDERQAIELLTEAQHSADPLLISPIYFFLPEDWSSLPNLEAAMSQPELKGLFDLRRESIAAGRGRNR